MAFRCYIHGCTAADHQKEYEYGLDNYGIDKIKKALINLTPEQMLLLQKIRLNWLNTKNPVYMFLSGSVVVDCIWEESICRQLEVMRENKVVEKTGLAYYLPHTLLSEEILENLPLPELSEEDYEIKKFYILSVRGIAGEVEAVDALSQFIEKTAVFLGRRVTKVIRGVPYVPQLANRYVEKIDILLKSIDGRLTGFGYVDINKTYHLGFSKVKNFLLYGLDHVFLLHPYLGQDFHYGVSNKIKNRWDISEAGYTVVNIMEEEIYLYKMPKVNRYLQMSISTQKYSSLIRSYIESL
ncbi:MAG: hypothetical protein ACK4M3_04960 [Pyrobaculum sp.]